MSMGALSGSREPSPSCTGLGPSGFDPERVPQVIRRLSPARIRNLMALHSNVVWETVAEMKHRGATGTGMDLLYCMEQPRLCERRWTRWGGEIGQSRGEGYEYRLTALGEAVRAAIAMETRRAIDSEAGVAAKP